MLLYTHLSGVAGWSSLVARRAHNPKVVSSNLAPATILQIHRLDELLFVFLFHLFFKLSTFIYPLFYRFILLTFWGF